MFKNQFKTAILLALLTALMLWAGNALGGRQGFYIALGFVLLFNFSTYFFSDKLVLRMYRAREVNEKENLKLFKIVHQVVHLAKVPMPKVYIIPSQSPNAFATGRNPKHAAVACTEGILELLNENELKGVIAHEISHVKNRDILVATIAATIAGVIAFLASMARWAAIFGGLGGRDRNGGSGLELLVLAILTPIVATLLQLAISRSREYLADEKAAKIIHNPYALADALEKLEMNVKHNPLQFRNKTTASLFIVTPFSMKGLLHLFSTHPPLKERVKRLRAMSP